MWGNLKSCGRLSIGPLFSAAFQNRSIACDQKSVRILVVDDEPQMARLLQSGLSEEGYQVSVARDGRQALEMAAASAFDVIVLDLMLPYVDGLAVAKRLRGDGNQTPVLMLTARDTIPDIVAGLDVGADDYLTKPFSFEVLLARLRAVSRRGPIPQPVIFQLADLRLDTAAHVVTRQGQEIHLTPREYSLLSLLFRNAGRPVTKDAILESIWGFDGEVGENTVEAFVRLLRNKIDTPFEPKLIHTVRGAGYCLRISET
jgi:DNA-binding response OmpR family regulator